MPAETSSAAVSGLIPWPLPTSLPGNSAASSRIRNWTFPLGYWSYSLHSRTPPIRNSLVYSSKPLDCSLHLVSKKIHLRSVSTCRRIIHSSRYFLLGLKFKPCL